ncbi:MAG TPA: alpha/beta hydrolase [Ilumatobacter sp.]|nr:alpha/beta hydrolase [Ilumatobacter sp.]
MSVAAADPPVVLVHGWGGSFATTWQRSGFTALLEDAGRRIVGVDLLGHGSAPKPHDPAAYSALPEHLLGQLPPASEGPVDAVGFSMGAMTLLRVALAHPQRFNRLVLAGIGRNVFERDDESKQRIVAAIQGGAATGDTPTGEPVDNQARLFAQYAEQSGNDPLALVAVMQAPPAPPLDDADLAAITCPVLVAVGADDFVLPADRLVDALPNARFVSLPRTDHFATPESFGLWDAVLDFLGAGI